MTTIKGKNADRFLKKMIETENRPITKKEKQTAKKIKDLDFKLAIDGDCRQCGKLCADICGLCHRKLVEEARKEILKELKEFFDLPNEPDFYFECGYNEIYELIKSLEEKE